jgi:hypothetical protein
MSLNEENKFLIKSIRYMPPPKNFIKLKENKPVLELYHKTREIDYNGNWVETSCIKLDIS